MLLRPLSLAVALLGLASALPAAAQFAKPEDAIKYRKSVMFLQGQHLGRVGAMSNGRVPFDARVATEQSQILETLVKLPWVGYVEGTDKGDTRAKSEIWKEKARFDGLSTKLQDEVTKLGAAAKAGNLDQIKASVGAVGQTCKACHDDFRKE